MYRLATWWTVWSSNPGGGKRFFSSPTRPDRPWGRRGYFRGYKALGASSWHPSHLSPSLRMGGAVPPPCMSSWRWQENVTSIFYILHSLTSVPLAHLSNTYDIGQGCTNPVRLVARATDFWTVAPHICGSSVWKLLLVTFLSDRILRWVVDFRKIYVPLSWAGIWHYKDLKLLNTTVIVLSATLISYPVVEKCLKPLKSQ